MQGTFNTFLVAVSYVISVFGSYVGLTLASKITGLGKALDRASLVGAAIALGGGAIWSMHFIGMLAYTPPIPVAYDPWVTLASLIVAVVFTGVGLYMVIRRPQLPFATLIGAGTLMGLGVAAMHYTGMAAMEMAGVMHHDTAIVLLSIAIAVVASTAALWIAFHVRTTWLKIASAFVMGAAVCGMHYTAMLGVSMKHDSQAAPIAASTVLAADLAAYVGLSAVVLLTFALVLSFAKDMQVWEKS
jgi:NO-binding membrane sensor protein with MHYT domain